MGGIRQVHIGTRSVERFRSVLAAEEVEEALAVARQARQRLSGRVVWNVNSTAVGGGVAEMLQSLLAYTRSLGIDTRWAVISGTPEFFHVTKRLHHALHGSEGDGSPLGDAEHRVYEEALRSNAVEMASRVQPGDFVILHDPQTAGMARHLLDAGAHVVWRCHVGHDTPGPEVERGWRFLAPYLEPISHYVFSRQAYVPDACDHGKSVVIQPSIDAFSPKNQDLEEDAIRTILVHTGLVEGPPPPRPDHTFLRDDGSPSRVERRADVKRLGRAPTWETPLVVQVSRWDPLKDPIGVLQGFARLVEGPLPIHPELVLAGPNVSGVSDDPEGGKVLEAVEAAWRALPHAVRDRVHLACLPTADVQENAAIVNALQRHATVVVQKSLHEGFGLTVTEAMWKARPVVASAVGGIQDQVEDGRSGILLKDPTDLDAFAAVLRELLPDAERRRRLGEAGRQRVRDHFLGLGHLVQYARLLDRVEREATGGG
jgi:trehalose synthase